MRTLLGRYKRLTDRDPGAEDGQAIARSIVRLCAAIRLVAHDADAIRRVEARIGQRPARLAGLRVDWQEFVPDIRVPAIKKAAVLKPRISGREKGVVFISFEDQWARLLQHCDVKEFARHYWLVVSPTWCPPHSLVNYVFPAMYPDPIFSLISNEKDVHYLACLSPKNVVVPLFASSWVNPAHYRPRPWDERDIDIIMVANFGTYKRHHVLFKALRRMAADLRVVLIGQDQDRRTADTVRDEARCYSVEGRITVRPNVSNDELAEALCRSKVSVILSRREGSCVAVVESMFADTPVGLLDGAEIGSRAFINRATGRFLREPALAEDLTAFLAEAREYAPRQWAEKRISCFQSGTTLNAIVRDHAVRVGEEWTEDIRPLCWRPDPMLVHAEDRRAMVAERERIRVRFGIELGSGELPGDP